MKRIVKYPAEVNEDGAFKMYTPDLLRREIKTFFKGKPVWIEIYERGEKFTSSQMGYFRAVIVKRFQMALYREHGLEMTEHETARWIERQFLTDERTGKLGEVFEVTKGLGDLDKAQMSDLIDQSIRFASENLFEVIPDPDEFKKLYKQSNPT